MMDEKKPPCKECLIKIICEEPCDEAKEYYDHCDKQLRYYENNIKTPNKPKDFFKKYLQAYINFREIFDSNVDKNNISKGLYQHYKYTSSTT